MIVDENSLISLAFEQYQRSRFRTLLANPKRRERLLDKLNHVPPLDPRRTTWFPSFTKALESVNVAPSTQVLILSADPELDGQRMPFAKAVEAVPMGGWGTIIGISPLLAIYYGEVGERAAVIRKRS